MRWPWQRRTRINPRPYEVTIPPANTIFYIEDEALMIQTDCVKWLFQHTNDLADWDIGQCSNDLVGFRFSNPNTALLFKLAWGGR